MSSGDFVGDIPGQVSKYINLRVDVEINSQ